MKLCRYDNDRLGVVIDDMVHDISPLQDEIRASMPYAMKGDAVIAALPTWRDRMEEAAASAPGVQAADVALLCPVARPNKVMAAPTNYAAHVAEMGADKTLTHTRTARRGIGEAGIFLKANSALVGPSEGVPLRFLDRRNDHEVELTLIIGKEGSEISQEDALDYIAGYTIGLDMTLRGGEDRSFRKSIDGYAVMGPWMVTADEIPDPDNVPFTISVNGELRQDAHSSDLIYDIRRLIEFASSFYTLHPGDLYMTGSPQGVGPVVPGDMMHAECAQIGAMDVAVRANS